MELNLTPSDLLLQNNQIYISHDFTMWMIQSIITALIMGLIIGLGTGLMVQDVLVPWLRQKLLTPGKE